MGEDSSSEKTAGRRWALCVFRALQWRIACSKDSGEARHLEQRGGASRLCHEGWAVG